MLVTVAGDSDRYEPLPSLGELPSHLLRRLSPRGRRLLAVGGAALVVAAIVLVAVVAPHGRSRAAQHDAQNAQRAASDLAALRARYAREARPIRGTGPAAGQSHGRHALGPRRALVASLEAAVVADARQRSRSGELVGHYRSASCFKFPKGVHDPPPADDLARSVAIVECIAATAQVAPDSRTTTGSMIGQPYRARIDFPHGRYTFCKIVQQPGELAIERDAVLDVPKACSGGVS
jgi:type II secretory pathway component PulM